MPPSASVDGAPRKARAHDVIRVANQSHCGAKGVVGRFKVPYLSCSGSKRLSSRARTIGNLPSSATSLAFTLSYTQRITCWSSGNGRPRSTREVPTPDFLLLASAFLAFKTYTAAPRRPPSPLPLLRAPAAWLLSPAGNKCRFRPDKLPARRVGVGGPE